MTTKNEEHRIIKVADPCRFPVPKVVMFVSYEAILNGETQKSIDQLIHVSPFSW